MRLNNCGLPGLAAQGRVFPTSQRRAGVSTHLNKVKEAANKKTTKIAPLIFLKCLIGSGQTPNQLTSKDNELRRVDNWYRLKSWRLSVHGWAGWAHTPTTKYTAGNNHAGCGYINPHIPAGRAGQR